MGILQRIFHWYDKKTSWVEKSFVWTLAVVIFGIALHAPLSVGFGTLLPDYSLLIKSWKEILLGVAGVLLFFIVLKQKKWQLFKTPLFLAVIGFALLTILLAILSYGNKEATLAGVLVNLRYFFAFSLVYAAVKLYPKTVSLFLAAFIAGATVVVVFGALQATVLPYDILKYLGYSAATIAPYMTVDQNMDFIRINSTLRGPNPLGAYMIIVMSLFFALLAMKKWQHKAWRMGLLTALTVSAVVLWVTYSRSALIGTAVALLIIALAVYGGKAGRKVWLSLGLVALLITGGTMALRETDFVSTVILHEDPNEGGDVNSNDLHAESLVFGLGRMIQQPFGAGVGSTGSASIHTDTPVVIESQYLFTAHELGWIGIILFITIVAMVMHGLWQRRRSWVSLAIFASGVGILLVGLMQPVWIDDTVSITWWMLAAIALAQKPKRGLRL